MINSVSKLHEFGLRNDGHSMEDRPSIIHYVVQKEIVASMHQFIHQGKEHMPKAKLTASIQRNNYDVVNAATEQHLNVRSVARLE